MERHGHAPAPSAWRINPVTLDTSKRLGGLALAAALFVAACSGSGSSATPSSAASAAPPTAAGSAAPSDAASSGAAAERRRHDAADRPDRQRHAAGLRRHVPGAAVHAVVRRLQRARCRTSRSTTRRSAPAAASRPSRTRPSTSAPRTRPMKDEEIAGLKPGVKILHVPTALGAVVIIYNVPGVDGAQPRRRDDRGHLPGHDQELERPEDRRAQRGRRRCPTSPSPSSTARTARARPTRSRPTSTP